MSWDASPTQELLARCADVAMDSPGLDTNEVRDVAMRLIGAGARLNAAGAHAFSPLGLVASSRKGHPRLCAFLIQHGADVHDIDLYGRTALDCFVQAIALEPRSVRREIVCRILLAAGSDPAHHAKYGLVPAECPIVAQTIARLRFEVHRYVGRTVNRGQLLKPNHTGGWEPRRQLLYTCVVNQFFELIASPLLRSTAPADLGTLREVWYCLPEYWQEKNMHTLALLTRLERSRQAAGFQSRVRARLEDGTSGESASKR